MTAGEELRAAAKVLRERAQKAPVGPWWPSLSPDDGTIVAHAEHPEDRETDGSCVAFFAYPDDEERRAYAGAFDAATYMATMHPLVGFQLAAWLELAAVDVDRIEDRPEHPARNLARMILGGAR